MRINTNFVYFIMAMLALGCSKKDKEIEPDDSSTREQIVFVSTNLGRPDAALIALDGKTGKAKWKIPFDGDIAVHSRRLYLNRKTWTNFKEYADTARIHTNSALSPRPQWKT